MKALLVAIVLALGTPSAHADEVCAVPCSDLALCMAIEDDRDRSRVELDTERALRQADAKACAADLEIERTARRECELAVSPPPTAPREEQRFYERASFWIGSGLAVAALAAGLTLDWGDAEPLAWGLGGIGVGIVIGGEL